VLTYRSGLATGLVVQVVLLAGLSGTVGLTPAGWVAGLLCGIVVNGAVARVLRASGRSLGTADVVTLFRAVLACGAAALVVASWQQRPALAALVTLATTALVLDAVDGWVARRTRSVSEFGARLDGEVDAFLIAVLSVYVAGSAGWWVLALGAARYVFAAAGWALPWLRGRLPFRYWRKVVTATQGIVLTAVAADVTPPLVTYAALAVAAALLAESFGRDVWWLWRQRSAVPATAAAEDAAADPGDPGDPGEPDDLTPVARRRRRVVGSAVTNALAVLLVWFALVPPSQAYRLKPDALLRIPVEGLVVAGLAIFLPSVARRVTAAVVGVLLALLALVKILDMGFFVAFDRPFDPVGDRGYLPGAVGLLDDSLGGVGTVLVLVAASVLVLVVLVGTPLSVVRLTGLLARHRRWSLRVVIALAVVSAGSAAAGLHVGQGLPLASTGASDLAVGHVRAIAADAREQRKFDAANAVDGFRGEPDKRLLAGLRGKDVLVVFVESYGRTALEGLPASPHVRAAVDEESDRLRASGYSSASAFLTSPTFGGISWLAHGTLQSGLWVDNQQRYDRLLSGNRLTLTRAFGDAGWRTVALMPSDSRRWPEGEAFYHFDKIYGRYSLGYRGPRFGFSKMPDQFALGAFQRLELSRPHRRPLMAEIDLASSHEPWARIPSLMAWDKLGDGTVFNQVPRVNRKKLFSHPAAVKAAYARSIVYTMRTLSSFVRRSHDKNLVLVVLGDHQPMTIVSGHGASRDVPVSVIAHDDKVIDQISGWGWQSGLRPGSQAPVWRMDAFRNRFFEAFRQGP
jgi:phosphatidylglycerophosphate synthase